MTNKAMDRKYDTPNPSDHIDSLGIGLDLVCITEHTETQQESTEALYHHLLLISFRRWNLGDQLVLD